MKIKNLLFLLFIVPIVPKLTAQCDEKIFKEIRINAGNKSIFNKLVTLYNPVLNPKLTSAQRAEQWQLLDNYLECLKKYYGFTVQKRYSLPLQKTLDSFDEAHNLIQEVTQSLSDKKSALKTFVNPLYIERDKIYEILKAAMQVLDKNTQIKTKKADPNAVFPGYEKFYKELISWTGTLVNEKRLFAFLYEKNILSQNPSSKNADVEKLTIDAKNFTAKLQRLIQILQENMTFFGKLTGTQKQIDTFKKVISHLENKYNFTQEETISNRLLEKLFITDDEASFLMVGQAKGLYDALQKLINFIEIRIRQ